jgi:hypothetical protein
MTTVVLYAKADFEPITVFKIPFSKRELLATKRPSFNVAIIPRISVISREPIAPSEVTCSRVLIEIERFIRNGQEHLFFVTGDEELALMLRSERLPGQQKDYQEAYQKGVIDGFIKALGEIL